MHPCNIRRVRHACKLDHREWVYEYYREYKKLRTKNKEWDEAQLANNLMGRIWENRMQQVGAGPSRPSL